MTGQLLPIDVSGQARASIHASWPLFRPLSFMIQLSDFFYLQRIILFLLSLVYLLLRLGERSYFRGVQAYVGVTFFSLLLGILSILITVGHDVLCVVIKYMYSLHKIPDLPTTWYIIKPVETWPENAVSLLLVVDVLWIVDMALRMAAVWLPISYWSFCGRTSSPSVKKIQHADHPAHQSEELQYKDHRFLLSIEFVGMLFCMLLMIAASLGLRLMFDGSQGFHATFLSALPYHALTIFQVVTCLMAILRVSAVIDSGERSLKALPKARNDRFTTKSSLELLARLCDKLRTVRLQFTWLIFLILCELVPMVILCIDGIMTPSSGGHIMFHKLNLDTLSLVHLFGSVTMIPHAILTLFQ